MLLNRMVSEPNAKQEQTEQSNSTAAQQEIKEYTQSRSTSLCTWHCLRWQHIHVCCTAPLRTGRLSCRFFCTIPSSAHGVQGKCKCFGKSTPRKALNLVCVQCAHVCRCRTPMLCNLNSTIVYHPCVYVDYRRSERAAAKYC